MFHRERAVIYLAAWQFVNPDDITGFSEVYTCCRHLISISRRHYTPQAQ